MTTGPILSRELRTAARRGQTYRRRAAFAAALLLALVLLFEVFFFGRGPDSSIREMATFSSYVFGFAACCQLGLTIWLVPACVAGVVAQEKERRTLTNLLTTRLSSVEIVLGKLAAGLVQYAACLATSVPILVLLPLLGGVDPWLVVLLYSGTASTAYFLAGLSILVSTAARRGVRAVGETIALAAVWCGLPVFVSSLLPRMWRWLVPWVHPVNEWVLASTPTGVLMEAVRAGPAWRPFDSMFRMIALQLAAGTLLIAWAVARFRRACREQHQEGAGTSAGARGLERIRGQLGRRLVGRSACGDEPVLWKELHTARPRGLGDVLGLAIAGALVALLVYTTGDFARPAFAEFYEKGLGRATSDARRLEFNEFLRYTTSWVEFVTLLIAAGIAAGSVTTERARQTWDSLIATPLAGRAILRAKTIGAAWKVRWGFLLLGLLWSLGVLAGAVHPLGFAAALVVLAVATWFTVALGTFMSLVSRDTAQASSRTIVPVLLLSASFLVCYLPGQAATIRMGAGSVPLVNWLALVSYRDVGQVLIGEESFSPLWEIGIFTYESPRRVLATCLLGTAFLAAAALALSRAALVRFERAAGRPERPAAPRDAPDALALPTHGQPPSAWWQRHRRIVFGLAPALAALGLACVLPSWRAARTLRDALAETDRLSPGWRVDELEAARSPVPESQDAARQVLAADLTLPASWRGTREQPSAAERQRLAAVAGHSPRECLDAATLQSLRAALVAAAPALAEARALADLPDGRFVVHWTRDGVSTPLPHLAMLRDVANLLATEALVQSQDQDVDAALTTCRALLNTARSIGDEPALVSQLDRAQLRVLACAQVELALAHGPASDAALARLQARLEAEEAEPLFLFAAKGDRALMDRFLASVESGLFPPRELRNVAGFRTAQLLVSTAPATRASLLRFHNRVEAIARLPVAAQAAELRRLEATVADLPPAARQLVPSYDRAAAAFRRSQARLRAAAAGLAAERYRRAHGEWPAALDALIPEYLAQRPSDLSSGVPLRYRRVGDGIVIDSRSEAGQNAVATPAAAGSDQEFRLWDPARRHQTPAAGGDRSGPG
jgi:ABC-type transport system involved in multi-copper enzyme maturation permease subunit